MLLKSDVTRDIWRCMSSVYEIKLFQLRGQGIRCSGVGCCSVVGGGCIADRPFEFPHSGAPSARCTIIQGSFGSAVEFCGLFCELLEEPHFSRFHLMVSGCDGPPGAHAYAVRDPSVELLRCLGLGIRRARGGGMLPMETLGTRSQQR